MAAGQIRLAGAAWRVGGDRHKHAATSGTHPDYTRDGVAYIHTVTDARNLDPVTEPTVSIAAIGGPDA